MDKLFSIYRLLETTAQDARNDRDFALMIWLISLLVVAAAATATVFLVRRYRRRAAEATKQEETPTYDIETLRTYYDLTPREGDVLGRMLAGDDDMAIAGQLGISLSTVQSYIRHIYEKTDARSFRELVGACRMCEKPEGPLT